MTDIQLYLSIGLPILINATMFGLVVMYFNARLEASEKRSDDRFHALNQRFDDMRDLWRAELHRVEQIIDARLKHLEER